MIIPINITHSSCGEDNIEGFLSLISELMNLKEDLENLKMFEGLLISEKLLPTSYNSDIDYIITINLNWQANSLKDVEEFFRQLNQEMESSAPSIVELTRNLWKINIIGFLLRLIFQMI